MNFKKWTGDGLFGKWEEDEYGLPSYIYAPKGRALTHKPEMTEDGIDVSPWHQIGNHRITATMHEDGYLQLYNSDRGLTCITPFIPELQLFGGAVGQLEFADGKKVLLRKSLLQSGNVKEILYGMGYGKFLYNVDGTDVEMLHWAPYGDDPLMITELTVDTKNCSLFPVACCLMFSVGYQFINFEAVYTGKKRQRIGYPAFNTALSFVSKNILNPLKLTTHYRRKKFTQQFLYEAEKIGEGAVYITPDSLTKNGQFQKEKPVSHMQFPLTFFSHSNDTHEFVEVLDSRQIFDKSGRIQKNLFSSPSCFRKYGHEPYAHPVVVAHNFKIDAKKTKNQFRVAWGYAEKEKISALTKLSDTLKIEDSLKLRENNACHFSIPDIPWVKREWLWHSDYLESAALYDEYFESHTIRQGSAYYFLQGMDGAPRDHMLFSVPMTYINPKLAKEILITALRYTYESGQISYGIFGYGKCSGFGVHDHPGDLPGTFLWALMEYIFATRDFDFLNEEHLYYPRDKKKTRTVRAQIEQTCNYMMHTIGSGEHGLLRVGTGDWNDPLQFHVRNRFTFLKKGESSYNTAMALYVLPRVSSLVATWNKNFAQTLNEFTDRLKNALLKQWNGKWLYRAWDGKGRRLGDKHLYVEHHGWALMAECLNEEQKKTLTDNLYEKCDKPSPIGAEILSPPRTLMFNLLPKGWDTNGGVWHAANMFLTWGYSKVNPDYARESLLKNTLCAHAEAYPHIWFGIWSAPDSYNAHDARNPGETFYHVTPMTDFPVMNANMHANPITAALKLCGIEPTLEGFHIAPKLPDKEFSLRTPLVSVERNESALSFSFKPAHEVKELKFTVEDKLCASKNASVRSGNKNIVIKKNSPSEISFELSGVRGSEFAWTLKK